MSNQPVAVERDTEDRAIKRCIDSFVEALTTSGYCALVIRQEGVQNFVCEA